MSPVREIPSRLKQLEKDCDRLGTYRRLSLEEFLGDPGAREDAVYLLFTSCQIALDVGAELLADISLPEPRGEAEVFTGLAEQDVLTEGCVAQLTAMHGLCHTLSQQYEEIDPRWVYQTIQVNLDGLNLFVQQVQTYLDK